MLIERHPIYKIHIKSISNSDMLTKYVVGAKANPPKNPRSPPKKGKVMPTNIVNAEIQIKIYKFLRGITNKLANGVAELRTDRSSDQRKMK